MGWVRGRAEASEEGAGAGGGGMGPGGCGRGRVRAGGGRSRIGQVREGQGWVGESGVAAGVGVGVLEPGGCGRGGMGEGGAWPQGEGEGGSGTDSERTCRSQFSTGVESRSWLDGTATWPPQSCTNLRDAESILWSSRFLRYSVDASRRGVPGEARLAERQEGRRRCAEPGTRQQARQGEQPIRVSLRPIPICLEQCYCCEHRERRVRALAAFTKCQNQKIC